MDMIERVARKIDPIRWAELNAMDPLDRAYPILMIAERQRAAAAIEEMREPTGDMGYAGLIATNGNSINGWPDEHRRQAFAALGDIGIGDMIAGNPSRWMKPVWRAMIDAALKGRP